MNLNINTGEIRLTINNDPSREIAFNPNDLGFVESFYDLISEFEKKSKEFEAKANGIEEETELDENGIYKNMKQRIGFTREVCQYLRDKLDGVFGAGTSNTVFGNVNTLDMFPEFFDGIIPFIQKVRSEKIAKYTSDRKQKRAALR